MDHPEDFTEREIAESVLTQQEVAAVRMPLEKASILPLRVYSNRAYYEREVDRVLRPGWHALARVDQLQETGAYVAADIAGEPVIVLRDKDGTIRALSNVCRHRGTKLLSDCGVAKALICPYHTWTYNLDGSLRGAPHMNKIDGFDRKSIHLPEFRVELWNGFVFVNLDADALPLASQIEGLTEKLQPFNLEDWVSIPYLVQDFNWNWKISLENFTEGYHHVGVHWHSVGQISPAEKMIYEETNTNWTLFYVDNEPPPGQEVDVEQFFFPPQPGVPRFFYEHIPSIDIFPTFHMIMSPSWALWLRIDVRGVDDHSLVWTWLLPKSSAALPDVEERMKQLDKFMMPIIDEDVGIMPRVRDALQSRAFSPGRYCDQERSLHQMHRWLINKMGEGV